MLTFHPLIPQFSLDPGFSKWAVKSWFRVSRVEREAPGTQTLFSVSRLGFHPMSNINEKRVRQVEKIWKSKPWTRCLVSGIIFSSTKWPKSHVAKMIYSGELEINLHYGGRAIQWIIIKVGSPSLNVSRLLTEDRAWWLELLTLGSGMCGARECCCTGEVLGFTIVQKAFVRMWPWRVRAVLGFRINKTNGRRWPFPYLTVQQFTKPAEGIFMALY